MNNYSYASMRDTFDMSAYFVVGPQDCKSRTITGVIEDALRGGATFIQLRAKNTDAKDITSMARDIAQVIENNGKSDSVAFVIDDRVDVVWQARHKGIKVDGVHIGDASDFPVVVGGGVTADDMEMLAHSKAAGWFVVSAIAGASDPEEATRNMVSRWKAVRGDAKHGHVLRK